MANVIGLNAGALGKVRQHYEEKLAEKDLVIAELKRLYDEARTQAETARGINELLRVQIAALGTILQSLGDQVGHAQRNVADLKAHLPPLKPGP